MAQNFFLFFSGLLTLTKVSQQVSVADSSPGKVYSFGPYPVRNFTLATTSSKKEQVVPPKPLLVIAPVGTGPFPVFVLQHGFMLRNEDYSQLMSQVASHGFVTIAPQMYSLPPGFNASSEVADVSSLLSWLPLSLTKAIPVLRPDWSKLALGGHSRGGKVAFAATLGASKSQVKALVGIDPVDGAPGIGQTTPKVLQYSPRSLGLRVPVLVVGTGLGPKPKSPISPACAPEKFGHKYFFSDSPAPAYHFVVNNYGHTDVLDDSLNSFLSKFAASACSSGESRGPMRRFTAGVIVAFLESVFRTNSTDLSDAVHNISHAPVAIDTPQVTGKPVPPRRQEVGSAAASLSGVS